MYRNGNQLRWKIKEVRFYFGYLYLSCLSDLKELVLGVGFSSSKYPTPFFRFSILPPLYAGRGKGLGVNKKIIIYRGTPAQFFFQSVDVVIFKQILSKFYKGGGRPCPKLFRMGRPLKSLFKHSIGASPFHLNGCCR